MGIADRKLRIGFVDHLRTSGGLRRFSELLVMALKESRPACEIQLIAPTDTLQKVHPVSKQFETQELVTDEVFSRFFPRRIFRGVPGVRQLKKLAWQALLKTALRRYRLDCQLQRALVKVDVAYFPHTLFLDYFQCEAPVVMTLHDVIWKYYPVFTPERTAWVERALPQWIVGSQAVVTGSNFMRQEIEKFYPHHAKRIEVIPYATPLLPLPKSGAERDKFLTTHKLGRSFIMCAGNIMPHKNLDNLIRAFGILKRRKSDLMVICTGAFTENAFGPENDDVLKQEVIVEWRARVAQLRETALEAQLELGRDVVGLGYVTDEELATLYAAATGVVMPAFIEAGSLPLQEAAATQVPIACSNIPPYREQAERHGLLPYYFDPRDPNSIADAIEELVRVPRLKKELIAVTNQVRALTWADIAQSYWRVFDSVVS